MGEGHIEDTAVPLSHRYKERDKAQITLIIIRDKAHTAVPTVQQRACGAICDLLSYTYSYRHNM